MKAISFPVTGQYGEDYNAVIDRVLHGKIRSMNLEGSGGFGKIIVETPDGKTLFLSAEFETHPDDRELPNSRARHRPVLNLKPEKDFDPTPQSDLTAYYDAIGEDRLKDAFEMRSTRSQTKTPYSEFAATWSNNDLVAVDQFVDCKESDDTATVTGVLRSKDLDSGGVKITALYNFSVKMTKEGKHWRYDGGDFLKIEPTAPSGHPNGLGGPPIQTDPAVIDTERFQPYTSVGLAVIAPSLSNRRIASYILGKVGVNEVQPKGAEGVLVVLSTISDSDPLNYSYESFADLNKAADSSGYISGTKHHVYLFRLNGDTSVTQVNHKSFESEE